MANEASDERGESANTTKMVAEPKYRTLDLSRIEDAGALSDLKRYQLGDLIRVPRTGQRASVGVVVGAQPNGDLRIEVQTHAGRAGLKEMNAAQVAEMNPLKIGDYFEFRGRPFWVYGVDGQGELVVLNQAGQRVEAYALRREIEAELEMGLEQTVRLSSLDFANTSKDSRTPTGPLPISRPLDKIPYVPIESILEADTLHGLIAGNKETDTVYGLKSPVAGAALHTNKGHNYKEWNEDGGALFADRQGRLFLGVFDQAGGEGSDKNARGAASAIAAQALFDRMKVVADSKGDADSAARGLIAAALDAHQAILARGLREVTTYVGAMIDLTEAVIVNLGDSGAMHFGATGQHLRSTEEQGIGNILLEGLGKYYGPGKGPDCKTYRWPIAKGEYLVFGSDGLLDAKLTREEIGAIIAKAGSAADATRALRDIVSQRMKVKAGKPDNLTILVVRVGDKGA